MTSDVWPQMTACSNFRPHADGGRNQSFNASVMFHTDFQPPGRNLIETGNHGARL